MVNIHMESKQCKSNFCNRGYHFITPSINYRSLDIFHQIRKLPRAVRAAQIIQKITSMILDTSADWLLNISSYLSSATEMTTVLAEYSLTETASNSLPKQDTKTSSRQTKNRAGSDIAFHNELGK